MSSKKKETGTVYTPINIVNDILDLVNYRDESILKKHIIDNSCGTGNFLTEIVKRYIEVSLRIGLKKSEIKSDLQTYIPGIEIDENKIRKARYSLQTITNSYGFESVNFDIICSNTLTENKFDNKMDYVVGNPPYIRVHNFGDSYDSIKNFTFSQKGMTDIYLVFYEIGLNMLNDNGILGYITPSSFFRSLAGEDTRKHFIENNLLVKVVDFKHNQVFDDASTYSTIVVLKNHKQDLIKYYEYDIHNKRPVFVEKLSRSDYLVQNKFYFSKKKDLSILSKILNNTKKCNLKVCYGYQTSADSVFISDDFNFKSKYIIPVVKASKGIVQKILYPYDNNGHIIPLNSFEKDVRSYLEANKELLSLRKGLTGEWYSFGRSQAINDTYKDKFSIMNTVRDEIKIIDAPSGTGVYNGLYCIGDKEEIKDSKKLIQSKEFKTYVSLLANCKKGGYYSFSANDLKVFLNYYLN